MERNFNLEPAVFANLVDLAQERLGGKVLFASDEFFAPKESLIKPGRSAFTPSTFNETGQVYDGWETRRKGGRQGMDFAIVELGVQCVIRGVDIDTNHFLGNHPPYAALDALRYDPAHRDVAKISKEDAQWQEILPRVPLKQGCQNIFSVGSPEIWQAVRLRIYPDGGVARLRVFGEVRMDWGSISEKTISDLALITHGGSVVACNDMFFGNKDNLIYPGRGINMGDGWETKRRREDGNDWVIVKLGSAGTVDNVEIDTNHFKGNAPKEAWIDCLHAPGSRVDYLTWPDYDWKPLIAKTETQPHHQHTFDHSKVLFKGPITHVRLNINNGGVSRLRINGHHI